MPLDAKMAGRKNSICESERRARLAMLESDSSLRSGLRRCISSGASAHSHPRAASTVPLWASASEIEVLDLTSEDEDLLPSDVGTDAESFVPSSCEHGYVRLGHCCKAVHNRVDSI